MADQSDLVGCEIAKAGSAVLISATQKQPVVTDAWKREKQWCNGGQVDGGKAKV